MATTVKAGTLVTRISETVIIGGKNMGSNYAKSVTGITNVSKSIITCLQNTEVAILGVAANLSTDLGKSYLAGQFDEDDIRYIRITNLDDTNYVFLTIRNHGNSSANEIAIILDKGCSYIYPLNLDGGTEGTIESSTSALNKANDDGLNNLVDIVGIANTAHVELEVFVATV